MLKRWFAIALLLSLTAVLLAADDKPKHNTLTPKEVADGWILLFDGESTFGWQSPNESKWTVTEGILAPQADKPGLLVTATAFAEYELKFDYICRPSGKDGKSAHLLINRDRAGDPLNKEMVGSAELLFKGDLWTTVTMKVKHGEFLNITYTGLGFNQSISRNLSQAAMPQQGHIALSGNGVVFRNIKLKPLDTKPLFNSKDLTGWKEFPGKKSKFTVSKEGTIDLKDGPGDLQTVDQYQDFILQAECISHGKHLNSGIFFRCIPNEYQNGYEAQIHNGWTEKPTKEYKIEEYDPKTNTLKKTEKIKSAAMDYGTGAIYNRMPARKEVAKDNEWFTMTIAAQGRHIATWVDGIQVVDWTDNRPLNDNPRKGCKVEKGAISLQGHDKTTDLSFRNIRIEELPPEKK